MIGTDPGPGISVDTGQAVKLIVSRGSNKVEVPSVIGLQDDQALARLQSADLAGTVVQRDSDEPAGRVVAQSPAAGRLVTSGSPVTIFVSSGAISVPNVLGQDPRFGGDGAEAGGLRGRDQRAADHRRRRRATASSTSSRPAGRAASAATR